MPLSRDWKLRALRRVLGEEQQTKGDEKVFFCPVCKHRKPKLCVNLTTDRVHCWICDKELSGYTLLPVLKLKGKGQDYKEYLEDLRARQGKPTQVEEKRYEEPCLPQEFRSLSVRWKSPYYEKAIEFLRGRGLTDRDILLYKLGYCEDGEYKNRVVIPSFDNEGELNFVVGRSLYDCGLNYMHGELDKDIIWNDYMVDWTKPVIVTEGQFDAITAGENAIALQGSIMQEGSRLFCRLVKSKVDVYFAMDSDAFDKQLKIIEMLLSYGVRSYYVNLAGAKDVNDLGREGFMRQKSIARPVSSTIDVLMMRVGAA